jgi:signal transduction histidine kinase
MVRTRLWAVTVAVILALAALNMRWLDRLRQADVAQMRLVAQQRAQGLEQEIDRELGRAYDLFNTEPSTLRGELWPDFLPEYDAWMAKAAHPALLRSWYVVHDDQHRRGLVLRRFDPQRRRFPTVPWPEELAQIRALVERENRQRLSGELPDELPHIGPEVDAPAAVLIPLFASDVAVRAGYGPSYGYVIGLIDTAYLRAQLFPAVARKYFGDGIGLEYDVWIAHAAAPASILYRTSDAAPSAPDIEAPLFHLGFAHLDEPFMASSATMLRGGHTPSPTAPGAWLLRARHRDGSIEAHVRKERRRDVVVSFAVMGLLVASLALLFTSARRARRLALQQTAFVAGVSHELRTPLAVIRSAAENLADGLVVEPERVRRYGELVVKEGRRLSHLVEQAIDFAALEPGARALHEESYDLAALVDEVTAQSRRAGVTGQVAAPLPPLKGDPKATRQVIASLVENAQKHAPDSPVAISVAAIAWRGRPGVRIEIADRGAGIEASDLPHVFEPFYRGQRAQHRHVPGSGLGLSIVKRLVEQQRGAITVRSTPGRGTTFVVCLPAA